MNSVSSTEYYELFRSELLPLIPDGNPGASVLDIGCASGKMLRHLRGRGYDTTVGIELIPTVAERARQLAEVSAVHCLDIDLKGLPESIGNFDLVVVSHVLEHLRDPWSLLQRVADHLKPGGCVIGALPNLRHHTVTWNLLARGRFDYVDHGILDRTHLRFFTESSLRTLVQQAGLHLEALVPELAGRKAKWISVASMGYLNAHLAYAYNFRCRKRV